MISKKIKTLALITALLGSTIFVTACDDNSSPQKFGTGALSNSGSSNTDFDPTVEYIETNVAVDEYLSGDLGLTVTANIWIEAILHSGPPVELYFLNADDTDQWTLEVFGSDLTGEFVPGNLANMVFSSDYPDLEGTLESNLTTPKSVVTPGFYKVLVENTIAGDVLPEEGSEPSVVTMRMYIEPIDSSDQPAAQLISQTKVRVFRNSKASK